jgi:hypothetical protein
LTASTAAPIAAKPAELRKQRTIGLVMRLLIAIFVTGLLPLAGVTVSALRGYSAASDKAVGATASVLDDASLKALQLRTEETAREIGHFLDARAGDVRTAAILPPDPAAFATFATVSTSELWYPAGTSAAPTEQRASFPLYREIVAIDATGNQIARVVDNKLQTAPGDPAQLAAYLADAKALQPGALSVSHLSRTYASRAPDDATRAPGADYATFDGVYRFIAARRAAMARSPAR